MSKIEMCQKESQEHRISLKRWKETIYKTCFGIFSEVDFCNFPNSYLWMWFSRLLVQHMWSCLVKYHLESQIETKSVQSNVTTPQFITRFKFWIWDNFGKCNFYHQSSKVLYLIPVMFFFGARLPQIKNESQEISILNFRIAFSS